MLSPFSKAKLTLEIKFSAESNFQNFVIPTDKMATHTILLVQSGVSDETRFYSDFDTLSQCLEGICKMYEETLRRKNPHVLNVTYDIGELFHFMEGLLDISCLVYEESTQSYSPHTREWLKERVYVFLQRQATTTKRSGQ